MPKMKWNLNGRGVAPQSREDSDLGYKGPDLPKGSWPAKIKRMTVHEIQSKANLGKPRISVLLEIQSNLLEGKEQFHGAPVWDNLNIIDSSVPFVNGFLHGLTDGSPAKKRAIEAAFWDEDKGPDFRKITVEKGKRAGEVDTHIVKIGGIKIESPKGEFMVQITTRPGNDGNGNYRPEVTGYLPYTDGKPVDDEDADVEDDEDEDVDDGLESDDDDDDEDEDDEDDEDDDDDAEDEEDDESDENDAEDEPPAKPVAKATARRKASF